MSDTKLICAYPRSDRTTAFMSSHSATLLSLGFCKHQMAMQTTPPWHTASPIPAASHSTHPFFFFRSVRKPFNVSEGTPFTLQHSHYQCGNVACVGTFTPPMESKKSLTVRTSPKSKASESPRKYHGPRKCSSSSSLQRARYRVPLA